jgi:hypothetical protein
MAALTVMIAAAAPAASPDWLKMKNADARAVKREAEEDWGSRRRR